MVGMIRPQPVSLYDEDGDYIGGNGAGGTSSTGTQTSVAAAAADTVILAANVNRRGATIENDSTAALNLLLGSGISSATVRTLQIAAGGYYEVPFGYTGAIKGIWTAANGAARVTEFT